MDNHQGSASLKDVAEAAEVSLTTASMSLSGKGNVSEETRSKVLMTAEKLGYRRTHNQKRSANEQMLTMGLMFDISVSTNHNWRHLRSYIEECQRNIVAKGGSLLLIPYNHLISEEENIKGIMKANIKGLISFSFYSESFLQKVERQGIPVVVFNNPSAHNHFVNVSLDDFQSTYEAVTYLIRLGHTNIMFAYTERQNLPNLSNNRFFAYQKALMESGLEYRKEMVIHINVESYENNLEMLNSLLKQKVRPTAALCLDDDLAAGIHYILQNLGYTVPEQMSIIAHGDLLDYSRFQTPRITTMRMDPLTSSKIAVELLIEKIKNPDMLVQTIKVQEHMRDRGSCLPLS